MIKLLRKFWLRLTKGVPVFFLIMKPKEEKKGNIVNISKNDIVIKVDYLFFRNKKQASKFESLLLEKKLPYEYGKLYSMENKGNDIE